MHPYQKISVKSSAIFCSFSHLVDGRSERCPRREVGNALKRRKGENRIRKLNVLCLERKAGLDIHSCWFAFSFLLDFFYNFCFDFIKSLLGFCYDFAASQEYNLCNMRSSVHLIMIGITHGGKSVFLLNPDGIKYSHT